MNLFRVPVRSRASGIRSRKCLRPVGLFLAKNDLVSSKLEGFLRHLPTSETNIVFGSSYDRPPAQDALSRTIPPALTLTRSFAQFFSSFTIFLLVIALAVTANPLVLHAKSKTYAKRGMWIGALSGAVAGGTFFAVATARSNCSYESDFEICGNAQGVTLMTIGGAVLGGLVGMGVGALIGSSIKREESVALAPMFFVDENRTVGGLTLRKAF